MLRLNAPPSTQLLRPCQGVPFGARDQHTKMNERVNIEINGELYVKTDAIENILTMFPTYLKFS